MSSLARSARLTCVASMFALLAFGAIAQETTGAVEDVPETAEALAEDAAAEASDAARLATEEADRIAEAARLAAEAEAARLAAEQAARIAEEARLAAEAEAARIAEEDRLAAIAAATEACLDTAGAPSAQVPVSEDAQRALFEALRQARTDCTRAVELDPQAGGPLFHLATIAQARARHREAVDIYERSAAAGIGPAHTRLGDYYNFAIGPIRADVDRAVGHYRDALALDDAAGTTTLAFMYRLGRGVPRDGAEMIRLFGIAADQGYHFAQYQLATTYLTGEGIASGVDADLGVPNPRAAVPLLAAAARQGNLQAALDLAQIYGEGAEGVPANAPSQFRWTNVAAEAGYPAAIAARAALLERGIGVAPDPGRAATEYVRALETGEVDTDDLRAAARGAAWDDATARAFQVILQDRGLYDGPIDGIIGRGTLSGAAALGD